MCLCGFCLICLWPVDFGNHRSGQRKQRNRARKQQRGGTCGEYSEIHIGKRVNFKSRIEDCSRNRENLEFLKEFEGSIKERFLSSSNIEELKAVDVSVGPLILTRCKSEPTRTEEKLDPDSNFWKRRRLGLIGSHSQPV